MTALDALCAILDAGGKAVPGRERPRLLSPPAMRPLIEAHREGLCALLLAYGAAMTVTPTPRGTIIVKPVARLTPELRDALRQYKAEIIWLLASGTQIAPAEEMPARPASPASAQISAYVATLGALWALGAEGPDADRAEIRRLLGEVARQCDELGETVALAVSRQAARAWARRERRCPFCGLAGIFHDPDSGEARALETP